MAGRINSLAELAAQPALILRSGFDRVETRKVYNVGPDGCRRRPADNADSHDLLQVIGSSEQRLSSRQLSQYASARKKTPIFQSHHLINESLSIL